MDRIVIDNSVVMAWCFEDEHSEYADRVLSILETSSGLVPSIWPLEICNILLAAERQRRLSQRDSIRFLSLVNDLPIQVIPEETNRVTNEIFTLARDQRLSSYDASYLDLAIRNKVPLATQDSPLREAARRCGVLLSF